jgi:hypothetical protein
MKINLIHKINRKFSTNFSNIGKLKKPTRPAFFKDYSLKQHDSELYEIMEDEKIRQTVGIELIASENYAGKAVLECMGSILTNKYSEGYIGKKYYGNIRM